MRLCNLIFGIMLLVSCDEFAAESDAVLCKTNKILTFNLNDHTSTRVMDGQTDTAKYNNII